MPDLLLHHVIGHVICSAAIETSAYTTNALGARVNLTRRAAAAAAAAGGGSESEDVSAGDDRLRFNAAVVTSADLMATDGVLHIIDRVVVPSDGLYSHVARGGVGHAPLADRAKSYSTVWRNKK